MDAFWRLFKYIKPQWPRVTFVVISALIIGILFSVSFMTVIPLLKVMMGEEGLHGWIDRKTCQWRYGIDFYVPDAVDLSSSTERNNLTIMGIEEDSISERSKVKLSDRIVGIKTGEKNYEDVTSAKLLEVLASYRNSHVKLHVMRVAEDNEFESKYIQLATPGPEEFKDKEKYGLLQRIKWNAKWLAIDSSQWLIGFLPREQASKEKSVVFIIIIMGIITIVRCTARFYQGYLSNKIVQVTVKGLREDTFAHILKMPVGFFSGSNTSDTISRLVGDINQSGNGIKVLFGKALREPTKAIFCLIGAMVISWKLVLIFLTCAPAIIGLGVILGRKIKKSSRKSMINSARMLARLKGAITALRVVKVYNRQDHEHEEFKKINAKFFKHKLKVARTDALTSPAMEVLGMIAGSVALIVGVHWVVNSGMQPSSFFGLLILIGTSAESVRKSSNIWNKIQQANAAAERVYSVVDQPLEIEKEGAQDIQPLREKIEFKEVVFSYPGSETPILKGINLEVKAGQTIAVVGPNGSGKTTLVNLIPRFYDPDNGKILIDNQDISQYTFKSLRDQIAMVTQNVVTFNDTIANNIAYGKPGASMEEIISAAKLSYAHEFIEPMPDGYETFIGEDNTGLSGGQLQRIVIARAVLKNPKILIFDEAMSQVDADSEAKIHKALEELTHDRTCFVIAHRFSTVVSADTIAVLDAGRIIAQGTHNDLMQTCQAYKNLYETQLMG